MSIKILPAEVANQIAAGEVVERPASVVKELIENSLDAGATAIEITIREDFLQVKDNGQGIAAEDLPLACQRHATSKVRTIDDIFQLHSFGFRGEALAAISAVSFVKITSRQAQDEAATQQEIREGKLSPAQTVAGNIGTEITVTNLFSATPARRQYLKTPATEFRHILKQVQTFALAHPGVSWRVWHGDTKKLDFATVKTPEARWQQLTKLADWVSVDFVTPVGRVWGYLNAPGQAQTNRNLQWLFVNQRPISDGRLNFAIRETLVRTCGLEKHLHPAFSLWIEVDPLLVDVNVHPRKTEVKFAEPNDMFRLLQQAVAQSLQTVSAQGTQQGRGEGGGSPKFIAPNTRRRDVFAPEFREQSAAAAQVYQSLFSAPPAGATANQAATTSTGSPQELTLIGQIARRYIAAQSEAGLYLFDQHALHERQRFEQLKTEWQTKKIITQPLLVPVVIDLPETVISWLHENQEVLTQAGFSITFPHDHQVVCDECPEGVPADTISDILTDLAQQFSSNSETIRERQVRQLLEYAACRSAVKFGDRLNPAEMQSLLDDFANNPAWKDLCPHGRPNHVFWGWNDLDQWFHR